MIITRLNGGIGNQMFQYAAGITLSEVRNTSLKLDICFLLDKSKRYYRHTHRDYALDVFEITGNIAEDDEISRYTVPRKGNKYLYHLRKHLRREYNVIRESSLRDIKDFFEFPGDAYLEGYWQNYSYISGHEKLIRKEFVFRNDLPPDSLQVLYRISQSNSVCIIFRRGDFVGHQELDIMDLEYYYQGVRILAESVPGAVFFVFSDDIAWCRKHFSPDRQNVIFVEESHTGPKGEYYMQLISSCGHFIIPNSSFAWWGAWLGKREDKLVIAPKKWHRTQVIQVNPILPPGWLSL